MQAFRTLTVALAAGAFYFVRSFTTCWTTTRLPGIAPASSGQFENEPGWRHLTTEDGLIGDVVLDIETYANRPDTLGHLGMAREIGAMLGVSKQAAQRKYAAKISA